MVGALIISTFFGEVPNAAILLVIVSMSIFLGFITEYRAEKAIEDLHSKVTHHATVIRNGVAVSLPTTELVPGDIVKLTIGSVIPADLKLIEVQDLQCDESLITGESLPVLKEVADGVKNKSENKISSLFFL